MKDVSELFYNWIACSNELWRKWLISRVKHTYECVEIEDALFRVLVTRSLDQSASTLTLQNLLGQLRVQYINDVQEDRQVCVTQKAGNIFCKTEKVTIQKGTDYIVKSIDTMGTMMNSEPYAEVIVGNKFILESPKNLRFLLPDKAS